MCCLAKQKENVSPHWIPSSKKKKNYLNPSAFNQQATVFTALKREKRVIFKSPSITLNSILPLIYDIGHEEDWEKKVRDSKT